jgi:hypothetical protein
MKINRVFKCTAHRLKQYNTSNVTSYLTAFAGQSMDQNYTLSYIAL